MVQWVDEIDYCSYFPMRRISGTTSNTTPEGVIEAPDIKATRACAIKLYAGFADPDVGWYRQALLQRLALLEQAGEAQDGARIDDLPRCHLLVIEGNRLHPVDRVVLNEAVGFPLRPPIEIHPLAQVTEQTFWYGTRNTVSLNWLNRWT